jgi:putative membrane protein
MKNKISNIKDFFINFFNGLCMAAADSVPGVSGGSIAFILGFYDLLINSIDGIRSKDKQTRKEALSFLIKLGLGWVIGMSISVLILTSVFEKNIYKISSLFMGFIILSIPIIYKEEKDNIKNHYKNIIFFIIGALFVILITYGNSVINAQADINNVTILSAIYIFIAGMIAINAMILPGISGSTLLLIFGLYLPIINGIKELLHFNFDPFIGLFIFGLGVLTGIFSTIKLIRKCLEKYRSQTIYCVIGLMLGSIYSIIMGPTTLDTPLDPISISTFSILFFIIGGIIVIGLQKIKEMMENN